ncbi:MAG: hypothetical protein ACP5L0_02930 [Caldisphaera sp.]|uniref:hypothetical protein n=1 Tax=Caldisphaera sp. TaxID=2060322 RepID=UPI0025C3FB9B|nr:hypothetical protein [Caldisphaera sp.]
MVSKATTIMLILFAATLISAGIGLYTYSGYSKPLAHIYPQPPLSKILNKISYMQYQIYSPIFGNSYVKLFNNATYQNGTALLYNVTTNSVVEKIVYKYNETGLTFLGVVIGNVTIPINASNYYTFYTSSYYFTNPYTGTSYLEPFPGIGPLYAIYYIGQIYKVDWQAISLGQAQPPNSYATINMGFTDIPVFNKKYPGFEISISPASTAVMPANYPVTFTATVVYIDGVSIASQMTIGVSSANYLSYTLTSLNSNISS